MKQKILKQIQDNHAKTNGKCGLRITDLKGELNTLRNILNQLYTEDKIIIREGVNNKLIFLKEK